jgi:ABC-type molybdate transport system ATPase subunit
MEVTCGGMNIVLPDDGNTVKRIALFPRDIYISETRPPGPEVNRFQGTITSIKSYQDAVRIEVEVGGNGLVAEVPHHIFEDMDLTVGKEVFLILKLRRIKAYQEGNLG